MKEKDYIGPDPVLWIERLMEVAATSQFTIEERACIFSYLGRCQGELKRIAESKEA